MHYSNLCYKMQAVNSYGPFTEIFLYVYCVTFDLNISW
jgi:hypothetical protein